MIRNQLREDSKYPLQSLQTFCLAFIIASYMDALGFICVCKPPPPRREARFIAPPPKEGTTLPPSPRTEASSVDFL